MRRNSNSGIARVGMVALGFSTLLLAASPARAVLIGGFHFTEVINTTGIYSSIGPPSINDAGTIAAVYGLDAGGQQVLTQQLEIANMTNISVGTLETAINNNGTVVFRESPSRLLAGDGGPLTLVVDSSGTFSVDGAAIEGIGGFDLGDNNVVVFGAALDSGRAGIFQRNLPGAAFITRIEADPSDFRFQFPAVNFQGKAAFLMNFMDSGSVTRLQILSDFGTIMDTNDEFDVTAGILITAGSIIDMNNANTVAFRAELDGGFQGIFKSVNGDPAVTVVDTAGPFASVRMPSISRVGGVAFLARVDGGGFAEGIYAGPNPVTDKIIAVGDVFKTKAGATRTVTEVKFSNDGFAGFGRIAFTVTDQFGEDYLISGGPALFDIELDNVVQLTTATDEKRDMMQEFTFPSNSETSLMFDYRNLTPGTQIVASINDIVVRTIIPRGVMSGFLTESVTIDPISLSGDDDLPEVLKLELVGGPGMTIQLDNIRFANFNLINGDFETGDLSGWQFDAGNGAALVVGRGLEPVFVPEPATVVLGWLSLSALSLARGRRRRSAGARS